MELRVPDIKLLNMDCMSYMATLKDKEVDLAIVDPPYGVGNFSQSDAIHKNVDWNDYIPTEEYFSELKRVSKRRIIWGANYYNCFEGGKGAIVWYKNVGHPDMSHCEIASVSWQVRVGYIHINWSGGVRAFKSIHPCEKPIKLYKWLLKNYAKPGDKILDTHGGSMSSAIACHQMGFDLTLCEIDKDYYETGVKRFNEAIKQQTLFAYQ